MIMSAPFQFKGFTISQREAPFKVGTDGVLLGAWTGVKSGQTILDIGTGTGLLALMLLHRGAGMATAIDRNPAAVRDASLNFFNSEFIEQISILHLDLCDFAASDKFDVIICNPPYFSESMRNEDSGLSEARHDFNLSLNQIFQFTSKHLAAAGHLAVILPWEKRENALAKASTAGLFPNRIRRIFAKSSDEVPIRILLEFSRSNASLVNEPDLPLRHHQEYSTDYKLLTAAFYLNF